jgi:hypothetical protein
MSRRGIDFLESWKRKYINITSVPNADVPKQAEWLAARCLPLAKVMGTSEEEIEEGPMQSLINHLAEELSE